MHDDSYTDDSHNDKDRYLIYYDQDNELSFAYYEDTTMQYKNFEQLAEWLYEEKYREMEVLLDNLEDMSEFDRGYYKGKITIYDELMHDIRRGIKHGLLDAVENTNEPQRGI